MCNLLAKCSQHKYQMLGIHSFSPSAKLVEIVACTLILYFFLTTFLETLHHLSNVKNLFLSSVS